MATIKGHEFKEITVRDSYNRRALKLNNKIITNFKRFNLTEDDIDIPMEMGMRKAEASISWYMWDEHLFFSYNGATKFVDNLAMIAQVLEHFSNLLLSEELSPEKFIKMFSEDSDILKQRKEARTVLGIDEDSKDFEAIHNNYRKLSKEFHPDMPNGNIDKFKKINLAHKVLRKELSENYH